MLVSSAVDAQDYYLELDGIPGGSNEAQHRNWIGILSFEHGIEIPGGGGAVGRAAGRPFFKNFRICKEIDKSTPSIQGTVARGTVVENAKFEVVGNGQVILRYEFSKVRLKDYYISGEQGEMPRDCVSLAFETIKVTYIAYDATGASTETVFEWDVESGH
ncbi:MAG: type VI secretion system tube protein Hcp [Gammaproteobacteria bacterium]|nr:type VI secretion system tube protein Hcp [Gammaproteobacteria bacterium]